MRLVDSGRSVEMVVLYGQPPCASAVAVICQRSYSQWRIMAAGEKLLLFRVLRVSYGEKNT